MKRLVLFSLLVCPSIVLAEMYTLTHEQWSVPRSVEVILDMPPVRTAINEFNQSEQSHLRLHYPGGDMGSLWIHELKSWLVALGVPENRIESIPGTQEKMTVKLEVVQ